MYAQVMDEQQPPKAGEAFNLQSLHMLVKDASGSMDIVKSVVQSECEEARFVLKSWPIETTTISKKVDASCCTCATVSY